MGMEEVTDMSVWVTRVFILILLSQEHFVGKGLLVWTLGSIPGSATLDKTLSFLALGLEETDSSEL